MKTKINKNIYWSSLTVIQLIELLDYSPIFTDKIRICLYVNKFPYTKAKEVYDRKGKALVKIACTKGLDAKCAAWLSRKIRRAHQLLNDTNSGKVINLFSKGASTEEEFKELISPLFDERFPYNSIHEFVQDIDHAETKINSRNFSEPQKIKNLVSLLLKNKQLFSLNAPEKPTTNAVPLSITDRIFLDYLKKYGSVRLYNAILSALSEGHFSLESFKQLPNEPLRARISALMGIPNLGRKSASEFCGILDRFRKHLAEEKNQDGQPTPTLDIQVGDDDAYVNKPLYDVVVNSPLSSTRLLHIFEQNRAELPHETIGNFTSDANISHTYRRLQNMGSKTIEELRIVVEDYLRNKEANFTDISQGCADSKQTKPIKSLSDLIDVMEAKIETLLNEKEKIIVYSRVITEFKKSTLVELGDKLGVTRERIRQIQVTALKKLRKGLLRLGSTAIDEILLNHIKAQVFTENSFLTTKQILKGLTQGKGHGLFILELMHSDVENFFNTHLYPSKVHDGWYLHPPKIEAVPQLISLEDAISKCRWPIKLDELSSLMNIPVEVIRSMIIDKKNYSARITNGVEFLSIKKVNKSDGMRFILRKYGKQLSLEQIKSEYQQLFNKNITLSHVGSTLGALEDALIVDRGVYNLYENLGLSAAELQFIRDRTEAYLLKKQSFISSKVIVKELSKDKSSENELFASINGYTLLGILQDDERFDTRRGFMIGLHSREFNAVYTDLGSEIVALFREQGRPLSIPEIIAHLSGHRDLLAPSLKGMLDSFSSIQLVATSKYSLVGTNLDNTTDFNITDDELFEDWEI